jgi:sugar lactone lactonase YvrE
LVNWDGPGRPRVWWIDSPKGKVWRWFTDVGAVRDLAALDKGGAAIFSRVERLRFILEYLGKRKVDEEVRKRVEQVLKYEEKEGRRIQNLRAESTGLKPAPQ